MATAPAHIDHGISEGEAEFAPCDRTACAFGAPTRAANIPAADLYQHHWRTSFPACPYVGIGMNYEEWEPAFRYGWETASRIRADGESFDELASVLEQHWLLARGESSLEWDEAEPAVRDAWEYALAHDR